LKEPEGAMKEKLMLGIMVLLLLSFTALSAGKKGVRKK